MKQQYQYMQGSKTINSSSGKDGVQLFTEGGGYPGA